VSINFKRSDKMLQKLVAQSQDGPVPFKKKKMPFGLELNQKEIPGVRHVVVVASGKGGVGKSTVSTNLAVALAAKGQKVGLLDADIYGPSSPTMLGLRGALEVSKRNKLLPQQAYGVKCVSFGFMSDEQNPVLWRGPMVAKAIKQFLYDVDWGELDTLVIDLPPGTGDVQLALIESIPIHEAIIVTTPQDVALIDAHKAVTMFEKLSVPIAGLIENMSVHVCQKCGFEEHIFGTDGVDKFAEKRSLAILGKIPLHVSVREGGDQGKPVALNTESPSGKVFSFIADTVICQTLG
jgi:ATP-binding protein involved in chromosome partitioning